MEKNLGKYDSFKTSTELDLELSTIKVLVIRTNKEFSSFLKGAKNRKDIEFVNSACASIYEFVENCHRGISMKENDFKLLLMGGGWNVGQQLHEIIKNFHESSEKIILNCDKIRDFFKDSMKRSVVEQHIEKIQQLLHQVIGAMDAKLQVENNNKGVVPNQNSNTSENFKNI